MTSPGVGSGALLAIFSGWPRLSKSNLHRDHYRDDHHHDSDDSRARSIVDVANVDAGGGETDTDRSDAKSRAPIRSRTPRGLNLQRTFHGGTLAAKREELTKRP